MKTLAGFTLTAEALADVQVAASRSLRRMSDALANLRRETDYGSDFGEVFRQERYRRRIEHERQLGLAHVRREAARVRRELGL